MVDISLRAPRWLGSLIQTAGQSVVTHVIRVFSSNVRALADEELMALARDGEVRAFELISDRHARRGSSRERN